jgi:hypothetical protein
MRRWFLNFSLPVLKTKLFFKFLDASLKTLTNSEDCSKSRIKFLLWLSFTFIGRFSQVFIHGRLSEQFSGKQAALEQHLESQGAIGRPEQAP